MYDNEAKSCRTAITSLELFWDPENEALALIARMGIDASHIA